MLKQQPSYFRFLIDLLKYLILGNIVLFILYILLTIPIQGLRGSVGISYPRLLFYASAVSIIVFIISRLDQRTVMLPMPPDTKIEDLKRQLLAKKYDILEETSNRLVLQSRSLYKKINYLGENILTLHCKDQQVSVAGVNADIRAVRRILVRTEDSDPQ